MSSRRWLTHLFADTPDVMKPCTTLSVNSTPARPCLHELDTEAVFCPKIRPAVEFAARNRPDVEFADKNEVR